MAPSTKLSFIIPPPQNINVGKNKINHAKTLELPGYRILNNLYNFQTPINEKQAVKDKLKLPVKRDKNGALIPTPFTDKETQFIIDVMLKPRRDSNLKKFGGGIQKHWGKMSKKERADNE